MSVVLQSTRNIKANNLKVVIYGPAKIGKTRLAINAPSPVVISTEKGLLSLRKENIPYIQVDDLKELAEAYTWATKSNESRQFRTFIFDSISDLGEVVLGHEKKNNRNGQKAYGNTNDTVMQIFRDFRDIDKHVCFIAKEMQYSGANNMQCVRPTMPDAYLTGQLPYMFDCILHYEHLLHESNWWQVLRCKASEQVTAGDRSGTLDEFEEPHLGKLFQKIAKG